jgi:ribonuclease/clavin/mitogillin
MDHLGGVKDLQTLDPPPTIHKHSPLHDWRPIADSQRFDVEGARLRAFHCPGHTRDHMAFVLLDEDALFTGDNVLGHGTAVFEDLPVYIDSLTRMAAAVAGRAYPGHGDVLADGPSRIREYIDHRASREKEVLEVLGRAGGDGVASSSSLGSMDIVRVIYQDTPENLHFAASRGVVQILEKLVAEGKVVHSEEENTWALTSKALL